MLAIPTYYRPSSPAPKFFISCNMHLTRYSRHGIKTIFDTPNSKNIQTFKLLLATAFAILKMFPLSLFILNILFVAFTVWTQQSWKKDTSLTCLLRGLLVVLLWSPALGSDHQPPIWAEFIVLFGGVSLVPFIRHFISHYIIPR